MFTDDPRTNSEDALILKVIEAYCTSAKTRHTVNSCKYHHGNNILVGEYICNFLKFEL